MKYITTPIFYINAKPHIGTASSVLAADILTRHYKLKGEETFLLAGTDEHGEKANLAATNAGLPYQEYVDATSQTFQDAWQKLNIAYSGFIRTTDPKHINGVGQFLTRLNQNDHIYKGTFTGWYCVGCEEFKTDTDAKDNNFTCPIHNAPLKQVDEPTYFFRLSAWKEQIIKLIESNELEIIPTSRKNEILSFINKEDLRDVAITRQNDPSGVKLPWDDQFTVYVWIDALLNYFTACTQDGPDFNVGRPIFPPSDQIIGKEILRFHAVIWPALLLADNQPLPKKLFVHSHLTVSGNKISKSLGNAIDPTALIDEWGVDAIRYYLAKIFPTNTDSNFDPTDLARVYESDLANNLGNLVNRVQTMLTKYTDDKVPTNPKDASWNDIPDQDLAKAIENYDFTAGINEIISVCNELNKFIEHSKPWELAKTDQIKLNEVISTLAHNLFSIGVWLLPFLPETSAKILGIFGTSCIDANYDTLKKTNDDLAGTIISPIAPLFPRRA